MISREEFGKLMKGMQAAYPSAKLVDTPEGIEMWYRGLKQFDYNAISLALQKHIFTNKFPPTIAEIVEIAANPEPIKDWSEGWGVVLYCIRNFGVYRIEEALNYMRAEDKLTYYVVKRLNFKEMCLSENLSIDRANFRMAYENERTYKREQRAIPPDVRLGLERLARKMTIPALSDDEQEHVRLMNRNGVDGRSAGR